MPTMQEHAIDAGRRRSVDTTADEGLVIVETDPFEAYAVRMGLRSATKGPSLPHSTNLIDYRTPAPPVPRRPGAARYWLWYFGGPTFLLAVAAIGLAVVALLSLIDVDLGYSVGRIVAETAVRSRRRRDW